MFSKTALTSVILGALYVNALSVPVAREPAPEPEYGLLSREAEPEIQELNARLIPLVAGAAAVGGLTALGGAIGLTVKGSKDAKKAKAAGNTREVQDWAKWAETARNQASKR